MDVIEPSHTECSLPIELLPEDGTFGFCVDYQELNAVTERDLYLIPHIDIVVDSQYSAAIFMTLDVKSRYWQV